MLLAVFVRLEYPFTVALPGTCLDREHQHAVASVCRRVV